MTAPKGIVYSNGWAVFPRGIIGTKSDAGLWSKLSPIEVRMYITIANAAKKDGEVEMSNADLMQAAWLDKDALPRARKGLVEVHKLLVAAPVDLKRTRYKYTVLEPAEVETAASVAPETVNGILVVRRDAEFHGYIKAATTPNLDGVKGGLVTVVAAAAVEPAVTLDAPVKPTLPAPPAIASRLAGAVTVVAKRLVDPDAAPAVKPTVQAPAIRPRVAPTAKPAPLVDLSGKPAFPAPPVTRPRVVRVTA